MEIISEYLAPKVVLQIEAKASGINDRTIQRDCLLSKIELTYRTEDTYPEPRKYFPSVPCDSLPEDMFAIVQRTLNSTNVKQELRRRAYLK